MLDDDVEGLGALVDVVVVLGGIDEVGRGTVDVVIGTALVVVTM